jgi:hypothetical protein
VEVFRRGKARASEMVPRHREIQLARPISAGDLDPSLATVIFVPLMLSQSRVP